ncbi:hypothetical protein CAC42_3656 [Sphaceloma murrayae]|uniref:Uncharacterized protein n=1 Tax=Sphaceloma murrayae TaxID=2082308 RepID=A0A2K1QPR1_9PEZI|nr:hypothetical protein CAC42_3656 [Sphaceloma murrayae]
MGFRSLVYVVEMLVVYATFFALWRASSLYPPDSKASEWIEILERRGLAHLSDDFASYEAMLLPRGSLLAVEKIARALRDHSAIWYQFPIIRDPSALFGDRIALHWMASKTEHLTNFSAANSLAYENVLRLTGVHGGDIGRHLESYQNVLAKIDVSGADWLLAEVELYLTLLDNQPIPSSWRVLEYFHRQKQLQQLRQRLLTFAGQLREAFMESIYEAFQVEQSIEGTFDLLEQIQRTILLDIVALAFILHRSQNATLMSSNWSSYDKMLLELSVQSLARAALFCVIFHLNNAGTLQLLKDTRPHVMAIYTIIRDLEQLLHLEIWIPDTQSSTAHSLVRAETSLRNLKHHMKEVRRVGRLAVRGSGIKWIRGALNSSSPVPSDPVWSMFHSWTPDIDDKLRRKDEVFSFGDEYKMNWPSIFIFEAYTPPALA